MNYSAQAIVVDTQGRFYLEDNCVTGMISFLGGKCEENESYEATIIREIQEELGLILGGDRFLDGQIQPVRSFWNARKQAFIDWTSKYFVLILNEDERNCIKPQDSLRIIENWKILDTFPDDKFLPLGREEYMKQIQRALSYIV